MTEHSGTKTFLLKDGYAVIPLFAPLVGGILSAYIYLFCISAHWPMEEVADMRQLTSL